MNTPQPHHPADQKDSPDSASEPAPKRRLVFWSVLTLLAGIMFVVAGGIFWFSPSLFESILAFPETRLLENPLAPGAETERKQETSPASSLPRNPTSPILNIEETLASLKESVGHIEATIVVIEQRFESLEARLDRITSQLEKHTPAPGDEVSLLIAIEQLRQSLIEGRPYAEDLKILAQNLPPQAEASQPLAILRLHAQTGLPGQKELGRQFAENAALWANASETETMAGDENGFWATLFSPFEGLVRVRKTGEQAGDSPESRVARAEQRLSEEAWEAAATEMASLPVTSAQTWARQVFERVKSETALNDLITLISQPPRID